MARTTPPSKVLSINGYRARFAHSVEDIHAAQRLRFEVFNLELQKGFAAAYALGRDEDALDRFCHHLLVEDPTGRVVGTYRMLSKELLEDTALGLQASTAFDLSTIPADVISNSVEVGRACVAQAHRSGRVISMLWRGLAHYMSWSRSRFLFGCCSVQATSREDGHRLYRTLLQRSSVFSDTFMVTPLPGKDCRIAPVVSETLSSMPSSSLFEGYLRLGARVCGPPAIDEAFGCVDFFVVLDLHTLPPRAQRFFRVTGWKQP